MSLSTEVKDSIMIDALMNGDNISKAMAKVGYSQNVIAKQSGRVTARLRERLCETLHKAGISPEYLTEKLVNGIENSTKPIVNDKMIVDYPDHPTRLSYLRELLKIMDAYPSDKLEISAETYEERILRLHSQANHDQDNDD